MEYPKWINRGHGLGPVQALNEEEEQDILNDIKSRKAAVKAQQDADDGTSATHFELAGAGAEINPGDQDNEDDANEVKQPKQTEQPKHQQGHKRR